MSGSSCVLINAATMSGTVAVRAYQTAPPTRNTPAVVRSALALQLAIALPAEARVGIAEFTGTGSARCRQPPSRDDGPRLHASVFGFELVRERDDYDPQDLGDLRGGGHRTWRADDRRNSDQDVLNLLDRDTSLDGGADMHEI